MFALWYWKSIGAGSIRRMLLNFQISDLIFIMFIGFNLSTSSSSQVLLGGIGPGFSSFIFVTAWNLYNWRHFCRINRVQLSVYPCSLQVIIVGHAVKYISYPIFITVVSVKGEMDDTPIWWTGQHLWVSLVSTVHILLETSWCWTVLYVLPSKMPLLCLL